MMELRVLRYFLTVVREESIVKAAEVLHVTQPTLSRQLKELEEEFGAALFIRGNRSQALTLTDKGMLLRKRAEELIELADRTQAEMTNDDTSISGDVMIGGGESDAMRIIARAARQLQERYPLIHYHLYSGNAEDVKERLDKGLLDFGVFVQPTDLQKYEKLRLPAADRWGLIVRADSPLAVKTSLTAQELIGLPLIFSRQQRVAKAFEDWFGVSIEDLQIVATYNLAYNASLLVAEGFGHLLTLDELIPAGPESPFRFIPLMPEIDVHLDFAWKKYQIQSKAAEAFLHEIQKLCAE